MSESSQRTTRPVVDERQLLLPFYRDEFSGDPLGKRVV